MTQFKKENVFLRATIFKKRLELLETKKHLYASNPSQNQKIKYQLTQFNRIWEKAYTSIPFYKKRKELFKLPDRINQLSELKHFPILRKNDIQDNNAEIFRNYSKKEAKWTGGSTGEPTRFPFTEKDRELAYVDVYLGRSFWGIEPFDPTVLIWGHAHLFGNGLVGYFNKFKRSIFDKIIKIHRCSAYDIREKNMKKIVNVLRSKPTAVLIGYAGTLVYLAKFIERNGIFSTGMRLKGVIVTAETITSEEIELLEKVFKTNIIIEYGLAELGAVAYSVRNVNNIEVFWDSFIVQDMGGQLLITTIGNKSFPLIRYDTNDLGVVEMSYKSSILSFRKIVGRANDFITIKLKNNMTACVHSEMFTHILKSLQEVRFFYIFQDEKTIQISIAAKDGYLLDIKKAFILEIKKEYPEIMADQFLFLKLKEPMRTRAGKTKWVEVKKKGE